MRQFFASTVVLFLFVSLCVGQSTSAATGNAPLLLRQPAVSKTQIVFNYAGDLWIVGRDGGDARPADVGGRDGDEPCVFAGRRVDRVHRKLCG